MLLHTLWFFTPLFFLSLPLRWCRLRASSTKRRRLVHSTTRERLNDGGKSFFSQQNADDDDEREREWEWTGIDETGACANVFVRWNRTSTRGVGWARKKTGDFYYWFCAQSALVCMEPSFFFAEQFYYCVAFTKFKETLSTSCKNFPSRGAAEEFWFLSHLCAPSLERRSRVARNSIWEPERWHISSTRKRTRANTELERLRPLLKI